MKAIRLRPLVLVLLVANGTFALGLGGCNASIGGSTSTQDKNAAPNATSSAGGAGTSSGSGSAPTPGASSSSSAPMAGTVPGSSTGVASPPASGGDAFGTVDIANTSDKAIARLTNTQFLHSAAALVGDAAVAGVETLLPDQDIQDGYFRNTGFVQEQLYSAVQGYDAAATAIVGNVASWAAFHQRWGGCTQSACIQTFLGTFLEAAFRRPVSSTEVAAFQPILDAATASSLSYDDTVGLLVRATLQAPEFLYLFFEPTLTDYQLAARLSYIITDGPPDALLYAAAKNQELRTSAGLDKQIDRLLAGGLDAFAQAFGFDYLVLRKAVTRNVNQTSTSMAADPTQVKQFIDSAVASFASLVNGNQPIGSVLTTDTFVVNGPTAAWMAGASGAAAGAGAGAGTAGTNSTTVVNPTASYPFMGLLTHPATLIAVSNAVFGSTVSRGQFLAGQMLCVPPTPPPPPGIQLTDLSAALPPSPTARDIAEARLHDTRCAGCHAQFEAYSFALDKWGGDGLFKNDPLLEDNGPIMTGLGDITFDGYRDFLPKLAASTQFKRCLTDHLVRFGLQHTAYPPDLVQTVLDGAAAASQSSSVTGSVSSSAPTFRSLLRSLVRQPIFATR